MKFNRLRILVLSLVISITSTASPTFALTKSELKNPAYRAAEKSSYDDYIVNNYDFLSSSERDKFESTQKEIDDFYDEMSKVYDKSDGNLTSKDESYIKDLNIKIRKLEQSISDINKKISVFNNQKLVNSYTFLSDSERTLLLDTYNKIDDIYYKKSEISNGESYDNLSSNEQSEIKDCDQKLSDLNKSIDTIEIKIQYNENKKAVESYTFLSADEQHKLLEVNNKISDLGREINAIYALNNYNNLSDSRNSKVKELSHEIYKLRKSTRDISRKITYNSNTNLVNEYDSLNDTEKQKLITAYNNSYEISCQLDDIYQGNENLSEDDEKKIDELNKKIDDIYSTISPIQQKAFEN